MTTTEYAQNYAKFYETLTPLSSKKEYEVFFDENSGFEDPFQRVRGVDAIHHIFADMYKTLHKPRFVIDELITNDDVTYIRWVFKYARSSKHDEESFVGISRVLFRENGKVESHIDYWDAASNVYEKIPLLGSILRFIKRRLHA